MAMTSEELEKLGESVRNEESELVFDSATGQFIQKPKSSVTNNQEAGTVKVDMARDGFAF